LFECQPFPRFLLKKSSVSFLIHLQNKGDENLGQKPQFSSGFMPITKGKELPAEDNKAAISPKMAFHKSGSSSRLRDWNPDVRVAQRMGVTITYASRSNEIREFLQQ